MDRRTKRDRHALDDDGMVLCNPRDREAAHRAEHENIATSDLDAVTCRKCLARITPEQRRSFVNARAVAASPALQLHVAQGDDYALLDLVDRLVRRLMRTHAPAETHVLHVDSVFDHKWLAFSGKVLGALGTWSQDLRLPPFHPSRIVDHRCFDSNAKLRAVDQDVHVHQRSEENQRRRVRDLMPDRLLVWYSGRSLELRRATLMVYAPSKPAPYAWFVTLLADPWRAHKTTDISTIEFERLIGP